MQVQRAAITEGRAVTLRSARLPRPMAAEVAVQALVLLRVVLADAVGVSVQRVQLPIQ